MFRISLKEMLGKVIIGKNKTVLLDIEGTTTSISFVKDELFPYVRSHIKEYIDTHWNEVQVQDDVQALREQIEDDRKNGLPVPVEIPETSDVNEIKKMVVKYVYNQMDLDRKTTALKQLQGHIWRTAYENEKIFGHVYDDVKPFLTFCALLSKKVYIYSSGSVDAQKLLFGHSKAGNLLPYISGHFDTKVGAKIESSSYVVIAEKLNCDPSTIIFFTDIPKEAQAAKISGMNAVLVQREGNSPLTEDDKEICTLISSFEEVTIV